jgi:hypothetical protein
MLSTQTWSATLVCRLVADVLGRTMGMSDNAAGLVRSHAPIFSRLELDAHTGHVSATFTPEGLACFRGWLRRQGLAPQGGTS